MTRRQPKPEMHRGQRRRAFSMLEVSLAVLIGGIILMATTGVFNALDRADRTLKARSEQASQLNRLHTVMRRTFVNLAMSSRPMPRQRPASSAAPAPADRTPVADNPGRPAPPRPDPAADAPPEPPRVILTEDRRVSGTAMRKMEGTGLGSSSSPTVWPPQRLEVVLGRPPVPIRQGPSDHARTVFPEASVGRDDPTDERIAGAKLSRGIFELTPVEPGARGPGNSPARSITTWSLWWRPLPPSAAAGSGPEGGSVRDLDLPPPTLIVTDLTYLRWQFFDDRERKTEFATAYVNGLPAYVELEVQTAAGLWANWLFEVDFIMSSEEEASVPDASPAPGSGVRPVRPPGGATRPPAAPPGGRGGAR